MGWNENGMEWGWCWLGNDGSFYEDGLLESYSYSSSPPREVTRRDSDSEGGRFGSNFARRSTSPFTVLPSASIDIIRLIHPAHTSYIHRCPASRGTISSRTSNINLEWYLDFSNTCQCYDPYDLTTPSSSSIHLIIRHTYIGAQPRAVHSFHNHQPSFYFHLWGMVFVYLRDAPDV